MLICYYIILIVIIISTINKKDDEYDRLYIEYKDKQKVLKALKEIQR